MVHKDMNVRENLTMDGNHCTATAATTPNAVHTTFTNRRGCMLSYTTLFLLGAFFVCTLLAVSLIIYNFGTCEPLTTKAGDEIICTPRHLQNNLNNKNATELSGNKKNMTQHEKDVRLPRAIRPLKYNITIVPYFQGNFTFDGEVQIRFLVLEDCYNITMHATGLNIEKNSIAIVMAAADNENRKKIAKENAAKAEVNNYDIRVRKQYLLEAKQFFVIEVYDKLLRDNEYVITLKFNGYMEDYLEGFYRSSYKVQNETRWIASTQFQATDARRAFPCFDEPALKANFTLNIARPANMTTVSNMPIVATKKHATISNYVWDYFAESVPMSTYLVAYAITDFSHLSDGNFSVWARNDAIQSAKYALMVGPKILKFLEEFFDVKFPLPKMDMIALPDFQAGAMENWGLVTFRETTMLYETGVSATTNKQRVASVVGHELAHQWFGNLVTPSWWSDIWLNEGFASYMEYLTVDAIHPEWKTMDQFVVNELQNVFTLDALSTSHKISVEVHNPDEITEIFDRISYGKGSTIIRMMSHFLTSSVFRRGLSTYLSEMAYNSATQDDLWRYLTNAATSAGLLDNSTSVKEIMDTWTLQIGFPVLLVTRSTDTNVIRLEQRRFLYVNKSTTITPEHTNEESPLWWIPITFTTSNELNFENTRPITWIPRTRTYEIENHNLSNADWYIFNIQQTAYYRTNYDLDNWNALVAHLMHNEKYRDIAPANRAQLLDDAMNLARSGYLPYDIALNLTQYLEHETEHVPWKSAITAFNFIDSMFVNQGDYDIWKNYLLKLLKNVYKDVRFQDDPAESNMLSLFKRGEILNLACHLGHTECIAESSRHFQNWVQVPNPDNNNPISPNLRGVVYCTAIEYGTQAEWDFAFDRYLKSSVSTEKELLLSALGCSREPWILFRYLKRSIAGKTIRKQDVYRVFAAVSGNVIGQQIAFDFIRDNWNDIKTYMGSTMGNMNLILKFATKRMNTRFLLAELESFVNNEVKDSGRSIQQIVEQVHINVDWMHRNYKSIVKWLRQHNEH